MPYLKFKTTEGADTELSGSKVAAFVAAFEKAGNIACPNYALEYVNLYFERREFHIKMQKAKQLGNASAADAAGKEMDAASVKEDAALDAYEDAVEAGSPDLEPNPAFASKKKAVEAAPVAVAEEAPPSDLTKPQVKKMKPPALKAELKELGLSIQGSKSELLARLLDALKL